MSSYAAFYESTNRGDWFDPDGGQPWRPVPDVIDRLPKGKRHRAQEAWKCAMRFAAKLELDPMNATNPKMAAESGWSESFLKDGLRMLFEPYALVETERGVERIPLPPLMERERAHGRRKIHPVEETDGRKGFRLGGTPKTKGRSTRPADPAPLCTPPPGERQRQETTTTKEPSSSSFASHPATGPELPEDLVDAVGLLPGLGRGEIRDWVSTNPELARLVVRWVRANLLNPDKEKQPQTVGWATAAFRKWNARLKEPDGKTLADIEQEVAARERKWARRDPAAAEKAEAEKKAKAAAEAEVAAEEAARQRRLEAAWGRLPEPQRAEIIARVKAAHPECHRWPKMLEPLYLAELEKQLADERAP